MTREVAFQVSNLGGGARVVRVEPLTRRRLGIGLVDDLGRVRQHAVPADEHRGRPPTPCSPHGQPVDELQMRLLSDPTPARSSAQRAFSQ